MLDYLTMRKIIQNMSTNEPLFLRRFLIKNFAAIHEIKPVLTLSKPIYA